MRQFIEVDVQKQLEDDWYYKYYNNFIFFTDKNYSHAELVDIMKNIQQTYIKSDSFCGVEIDLDDLFNKFATYEIYRVLPVERYYFDIEEE